MAAPTAWDAAKPSPQGEGGPAKAGSDEVSAPEGAYPKDERRRIAPQAFPTVTTPVCELAQDLSRIILPKHLLVAVL